MPAVSPVLRVGLLGFSDIARRRLVPALPAAQCMLAAIGTKAREAALAWLPSGSAVAVCSHEELLARHDVDLVYVSTSNDQHADWSCRALAAGKHVLCEKPLAPTLADAIRTLAAARATGRLLFENVMFLQHPQHRVVLDLLAAGRIGRLRAVRTSFAFFHRQAGNYRLDPSRGGGACNDLLGYVASCACLFVPGDLRGATGHVTMANGIDVAAQGIARGDGEVFFAWSLGFRQQYECFYELVGEAGLLRLERAYSTPPDHANQLLLRGGNDTMHLPLPASDHFVETLRLVSHLVDHPEEREAAYATIARRHATMHLLRSSLQELP